MSRKSKRDDSRDENGRFLVGGICPNRYGRGGNPLKKPERQRSYLSDQVYADFQSIGEERRNATLDGKKVRLPAIELVYRRLFENAIAGDQRSIHRVLDMRERYAAARDRDQEILVAKASDIISDHELGLYKVPESLLLFARETMRVLGEGMFLPMNPPFNPVALMTRAEIETKREAIRRTKEEMAAMDAEPDPDPLDEVPGDQPEN